MQTVVETHAYLRQAERLFTVDEREALVSLVAANPKAGVLVADGGGLRKLRFGMEGRGKRGGARVIYCYADETIPVFLLAAFAKNEKEDASTSERRALRDDIDDIMRKRTKRK